MSEPGRSLLHVRFLEGRAAHTLAAAKPGRWLSIAFTAEAVILGAVAV